MRMFTRAVRVHAAKTLGLLQAQIRSGRQIGKSVAYYNTKQRLGLRGRVASEAYVLGNILRLSLKRVTIATSTRCLHPHAISGVEWNILFF